MGEEPLIACPSFDSVPLAECGVSFFFPKDCGSVEKGGLRRYFQRLRGRVVRASALRASGRGFDPHREPGDYSEVT